MIFYIPSSLAENSENASWKNTSLKENCTSTKKYISVRTLSFFLSYNPWLRELNIAIIKFLKIRIYCRTRASSSVIWGVPLHKREFQRAILDWFYNMKMSAIDVCQYGTEGRGLEIIKNSLYLNLNQNWWLILQTCTTKNYVKFCDMDFRKSCRIKKPQILHLFELSFFSVLQILVDVGGQRVLK